MTLSIKGLYVTVSIMPLSLNRLYVTLSLMTLSVKGLFVTLSISDSITMVCHHAKCHYAECGYAESRGTVLNTIELYYPQIIDEVIYL
jgi:hypothetical protein